MSLCLTERKIFHEGTEVIGANNLFVLYGPFVWDGASSINWLDAHKNATQDWGYRKDAQLLESTTLNSSPLVTEFWHILFTLSVKLLAPSLLPIWIAEFTLSRFETKSTREILQWMQNQSIQISCQFSELTQWNCSFCNAETVQARVLIENFNSFKVEQ